MSDKIRPDGIYKAVTKEGDLADLVFIMMQNYPSFSIDTETTGVDALNDEIIGISLSHRAGIGYYIPILEGYKLVKQRNLFDHSEEYLRLEVVRHYVNQLTSSNLMKYMHNAKYDIHVLTRYGFEINQPIYDTMLGSYVLGNVYGARYGLKDLTKRKLGFDMLEFKEVAGKNPFYSVPLDIATKYASADTDMTLRLSGLIHKKFEEFPSLRFIEDLEMKTMPVLVDMERVGALVNTDYLKGLSRRMGQEIGRLVPKIHDEFGYKFNINSNPELMEAFNNSFKIRLESADEKSLLAQIERVPIVADILNYRKRSHFKSTYVDGILQKLDKDSRVHTEFYQMLKTGRLSSKAPNLQNIPTKKDDEYKRDLPLLRQAFIAKPGYKFVSIDYSQLEIRVITHISEEPTWIKAFEDDKDIHSETAIALFGDEFLKADKDTKKQLRGKTKTVNFGLLYGQTPYGLSWRMNMSVADAEAFIANYFSVLPYVCQYIEDRKAEVRGRKYVETVFGRRLYFRYDIDDPKSIGAAEREAINMPIQGTSADLVKMSMIECHKYLKDKNSNLILQVHDELDFEIDEDEFDIVVPHLKNIMENIVDFKNVKLKCDVEFGPNWENLEEYLC